MTSFSSRGPSTKPARLAQKKALYRGLVELLAENPGLRPEDILINPLQAPLENWSWALARRNS